MSDETVINTNTSQIIQSLWIGGNLSTMEQLSAKSFIKWGHEYHLYTYGDVGNIPSGVVVRDANEILNQSEIFTYKNGSYSAFSNLFRFTLLEKRGGYWADTDLICVRSLKDLDDRDIVLVTEPTREYERTLPASCLIKLPRGSEIAKDGVRMQWEHKRQILNGRLTWSSGPTTVKYLVGKYNLHNRLLDWHAVCSCNWRDAVSLVKPDKIFHKSVIKRIEDIPQNMYCIHLWNEVWRRNQINKNDRFSEQSLYECLKRTILE